MKRWVLRAILCLLLGAITTVAVAWGCAIWSPTSSPLTPAEWKLRFKPSPADHMWWREHTGEEFETPLLVADHRNGFGVWLALLTGANPDHVQVEYEPIHISYQGWNRLRGQDRRPERFDRAFIAVAGWPQPAMMGIRWDTQIPRGQRGFMEEFEIAELRNFAVDPIRTSYTLGIPRDSGSKLVPCGPIPSGFAIDTLFYAAIWGGVFFGFASAKRAIRGRRRRGRCPRCGYDLRGALENGCSECGWGRGEEQSHARS